MAKITEVPIKVTVHGAAQEAVREFHETFDPESIPGGASMPSMEAARLRIRLMLEELDEVTAAMVKFYEGQQNAGDALVETAQELADLIYVTYGTAVTLGIDLDPVVMAVHQANMGKVWSAEELEETRLTDGCRVRDVGHGYVVYREDGKVMKPPSYTKSNVLAAIVIGAEEVDAVAGVVDYEPGQGQGQGQGQEGG